MINWNDEQKEIVRLIANFPKPEKGRRFSWNKFNGNMACNVIKKYLGKHLEANLKVVGPAFIRGYPTEFDLLVVDAESRPEEFTDAYNSESVHRVIEVKSHGTYTKDALKRIREIFEDLTKEYSKESLYLAIRESGMPKRAKTNWLDITREMLKPYKAFVLCDSRTKQLYQDQWKEFVNWCSSS